MIVVEGKCFLDERLERCCIGIEDGKIVEIKKVLKGDDHFDYGSNIVLPGCIDAHVHFREPGKIHKEDFFTGTLAAAFGGVTCAIDMPNNVPPVNDVGSLKNKLDIVRRKANIDFGLYSALVETDKIDSLSKLTTGFKVYMAETTDAGGITVGYSELAPLITSASANKIVSVHCEDERLVKKIEENGLEDHLTARPAVCETEGLKMVLEAAKKSGKNVHVAHVTSAEGAVMIEKMKATVPITSEVTGHHLLLNVNSDLKSFGKVNPPLRRKEDNEALRNAFFNGGIDILASDHAPHTIEEKNAEFTNVPSGMPGVETNIPIMLHFVKKKFLSLNRFVEATSSLPAQMFKLNKGVIGIGYDADMVVVDIKSVRKIRADELHSKCGWTPFEKYDAIFPKAVFLRGSLIVDDGNLTDERLGRFVGQ